MIIIGNKYGNWLVLEKADTGKKHTYYKCQCNCGKICLVRSDNLKSANSMWCRSCRHDSKIIEPQAIFGKWTVIEQMHTAEKRRSYKVRCECGNERIIKGARLHFGDSLGCRKCGSTKHGLSNSYTYSSWESMIQRCTNPKHSAYKFYGAKGIEVCDRWRSFQNFIYDMGERPPHLEIDRIDSNKNYEPGNCQWISHVDNLKKITKS